MREKKQKSRIKKKIKNLFNVIFKYVTSVYAILAVTFVLTSLLFFPSRGLIYNLHVGDVSPQTIRAEEDLLIEDKAATQLRIDEARKNVTPVFDFNPSVYLELSRNVRNSFSMGRNALPKLTTKQSIKKFETTFFKTMGIEADHSIFERLMGVRFSPEIEEAIVIVREGDIITPADYAKLTAMNMLERKKDIIFDYARITLLLAVFGFFSYLIMRHMGKRYLKDENHVRLFLVTFLLSVVVVKVYEYLASNISYSSALLSKISILYATPFAFGAAIIALTTSFELSLIFAFLDKAVNMQIALYVFLGSTGGSLCISKCKERAGIIKTGTNISLINVILILLFSMHEGFFSTHTLISCVFGIISGITVILIVSGILPVYEWLFGISTNIKLMELGNLNHPLLRELALKAPGTYQHSIAMSSLAESAAQAIGADSVLAKVGAYYHDIGKMSKPLYFIENQMSGVNKHNKLSPSMSALILIDHVKEGILLANKYRLGRRIKDIIQQHHGTTLIKYFYNKAKEQKMDVKEEEFRYKGPKPQTREAGIIMIADQIEAISRTLTDPSISHIKQVVKKTITDIFLDGQDNVFCRLLGDIVISWDRAKKDAREIKIPLKEELATLLIHGFLHLMGYRDDSEENFCKMKKKQEELLFLLKKKGYV